MKLLFLINIFCISWFFSNAQLSHPDTISDRQKYDRKKEGSLMNWYDSGRLLDSGSLQKGIPDGNWTGWYKNGQLQFIRTYSADKWQQFQNEKSRYHPKRVSMPITKLFHENKKQAEKYIIAINSFCAQQNCEGSNKENEHYHPSFEKGLLHGPFANYFPDGSIKDTGIYRDGLPEDLWTKWTEDKKFYWKGFYHHGMKNKEWKLYSSSNKLIRIVAYRDGKLLWRKDMKEGVEIKQEELSGF